mgnify:CR=1 FL=1
MKAPRVVRAIVVLIVTAGLSASCASLSTIETPTEAPLRTKAPPTQEPTAEPEPVTMFVFGRGSDSLQLDPAVVTDDESFRVSGQCLEPLYRYEPGSTRPIPALAAACTPNVGGTRWVCQLREGVEFHDGTAFDADAVVFNFERWRFTENPYHFESQVFEYYARMWDGFDDDSVITAIEKVGDYTVTFVLSAPRASFLATLAMDAFAISSPAAIEEYGAEYGLPEVGCVGTGPFVFQEWIEGDHITVRANDGHWDGRPTVDQVTWRVIPDPPLRFQSLKAGDIHAMAGATAEDLAAAEADPALDILVRPAMDTAYLAFPFRTEEFRDIRVREAVAHAIDREGLVRDFYGEYGEVATNLLPPVVWGHNDAIEDWAYDPALSRQLLAEAGFPDGLSEVTTAEDLEDAGGDVIYEAGDTLPLTLYYLPVPRPYYPAPREIGEAIVADLVSVGISVTLESTGDWLSYLELRRLGLLPGLYMHGWIGDNGDPADFHDYFFGGLSAPDEEKEPDPSQGFYANQEVAGLLYEAATRPDQAEREPLYKQVEQLLHDDVARLWIVHTSAPLLFSTQVSGYVPQPVGADYYEFTILE